MIEELVLLRNLKGPITIEEALRRAVLLRETREPDREEIFLQERGRARKIPVPREII